MTTGDEAVIATRLAYEADAASWASRDHNFQQRAEQQARLVKLVRQGGRVLDLGCGPGLDSGGLAGQGLDVIGLDITSVMLRIAAEKRPGTVVQGDARRLPFARASFDGVWASASLLHLPKSQVSLALGEVRRILRERGGFYTGMKAGEADELMVTRPQVVRHGRHFSHYRPAEWSDLLIEAGFRVVEQLVDNEEAVAPDTPWIVTLAVAV